MKIYLLPLAALMSLSACDASIPEDGTGIEADDIVRTEYPEKVAEVQAVLDDIQASIREGDIDRLIGHHAYSAKFTDFQNAGRVTGAAENEANERGFFGSATEVNRFVYADPRISVYGDVAVASVHADVDLEMGEERVVTQRQVTLVFVETADGWKIVHEHNSPLETDIAAEGV